MKAVALVLSLVILSACAEADDSAQRQAESEDYCRGAFAAAHTAKDSARVMAERPGWNGGIDGSWCARMIGRELRKATR